MQCLTLVLKKNVLSIRNEGLILLPLKNPICLETFDSQEPESGPITHYAQMHLRIGNHCEKGVCFWPRSWRTTIVLGLLWLKMHDPQVVFAAQTVEFNSEYLPEKLQYAHPSREDSHPAPDPLKSRPKYLPDRPEALEPLISRLCCLCPKELPVV